MIKNFIRSLFDVVGLEVRRKTPQKKNNETIIDVSNDHRRTMEESLLHLKQLGYQPKLIIDIGAASGTIPILNTFPAARHLLIEPLIEFEPTLTKLKESYNLDFLIAAVAIGTQEMSINVHKDLYGSSLLKEEDGSIADGVTRQVRVIALNEVPAHFNINVYEDTLIKVDVQGAELDVLKSGEDLLTKAAAVIIECSFFKFLKHSNDITDVIKYMQQHGFVMYDMFDFHNRPLDNALGQVDILFVKEGGMFRKSHNWATSEQRIKQLQIKI